MRAIALFVALAATSARADWQPPTRTETALLATAEVLVALDAATTVAWLQRCPATSYRCELNPVLGVRPSTGLVIGASAAAMLAIGAGWYFLPTPWRDAVTLGAIFVEGPVDTRNIVLLAGGRF